MQPMLKSGQSIFLLIMLIAAALLASACQPLTLKVDPVSAGGDLLKVAAPDCSYGGTIKAIEAVDPYTVRFTLCEPDPAFLNKIAFPAFAIQDSDYLNTHEGRSAEMSQIPNGSGPYRLREYVPRRLLTLEINPEYWGLPPNEPLLEFHWAPSPFARVNKVEFSQVDISDRPAAGVYAEVRKNPSLTLVYRPAINVSYLGMNNQYPPFDDERVRRAISLLIDRQRIVNDYYPLGSTVADQFLPSSIGLGYTPGYRWFDTDVEEGYKLLIEANFEFGQTLTLAYSNIPSDYLPDPESIASEIQRQLGNAGIDVQLLLMQQNEFQNAIAEGELAFYLSGWMADYPDPSNFYSTIFAPQTKAFGRPYNDIILMAKEAGSTPDPDVRQSRYDRINELLKSHIPAIPLAHGNTALVTAQNVQGLIVGSLNENLEEVSTPMDSLRLIQSYEPSSLWPGDESDSDTLRITRLLYDTLVEYETQGTGISPSLANYWESNSDRSVWNFHLRYGVKFTNGADLDANDVVATFSAQWDAASPNHTGRSGEFAIFKRFFGGFLNQAGSPGQ